MLKKGLFHTRRTVTCAYLLNVSGKIEYLAISSFNDGSDIPINTKRLMDLLLLISDKNLFQSRAVYIN